MTQPGQSGSPEQHNPSETNDVFPSRRALREQRAVEASSAGDSGAGDSGAGASAAKVAAPSHPSVRGSVGGRSGRAQKGRNPFTLALTLVAIPGIFLTAALPAYAFSPDTPVLDHASAAHSLTTTQAQAVSVGSAATTITVARDGFSATSEEELLQRAREAEEAAAAERAAKEARASAAAYAVYGVRAEGDDYPWPFEATDANGGGLSPLGYYYRECVDFVAWRLNRDAGSGTAPWRWTWSSLTPGGGNASSWAAAWSGQGRATSNTPVVGAVAWFTYNHVAYVREVPGDGTVVLEEYNWMGSHAYHTRTIPVGDVALYLYPPA